MSSPRLFPTLAVGYDAVVPIDPAVYEITDDARGRAFAFDIDAEREHVAAAVRESFDQPRTVEEVAVEPGYIRVKVVPTEDGPDPATVRDTLRSVPSTYNERYATDPDLNGLAVTDEFYIGTYRPDDAPDREAALGDLDLDDAPEADGPVFSRTRDDAGEVALRDHRRFAYRFTFPFDPDIYTSPSTLGGTDPFPLTWDSDAVISALELVVDKIPPWPRRAENLPYIAVYPSHAVVEFYTAGFKDPTAYADTARDAFLRYNGYRNPDERAGKHDSVLHPAIDFTRDAYIEAIDHGGDAGAWLREHDLDDVDGQPEYPDPDVPGDEGDGLGRLNPF